MTHCARCGAEATGNFCSSCGAPLEARPCPACGETPEPGARFCNHCGAPVVAGTGRGAVAAGDARAKPAGGNERTAVGTGRTGASGGGDPARSARLVWGVTGVFLLGLALIFALPLLRRDEAPPAAAPTDGPPDLSAMTPRQAADRLFNRVMLANEQGSAAEAQQFLPMAIQAHDMARPLDSDGLFHLALLHLLAGDAASARAVAEEVLASEPNYLLALAAGADAALAQGDQAAADAYYGRFLAAYDSEMARGLEEYGVHRVTIDQTRRDALATGP